MAGQNMLHDTCKVLIVCNLNFKTLCPVMDFCYQIVCFIPKLDHSILTVPKWLWQWIIFNWKNLLI